jgi:hypothetical protein
MTTKEQKQQAMFTLIESWQNSGQTQHEFCKKQEIAYSAFHYWYKKYRQYQTPHSAAFVPVTIQPLGSGSPVVELSLPDGRRLSFYQTVEASMLKALLS